MKSLKRYIKLVLKEAEENNIAATDEINNLFQSIVNRFPQELERPTTHATAPALAAPGRALASNKWKEYDSRYNFDKEFQALVNNGRIFRPHEYNIRFLNARTVQQYLKDELKAFDVLVYFDDEIHQRSKENLQRVLHIAETYEQFEIMVKRIAKEV